MAVKLWGYVTEVSAANKPEFVRITGPGYSQEHPVAAVDATTGKYEAPGLSSGVTYSLWLVKSNCAPTPSSVKTGFGALQRRDLVGPGREDPGPYYCVIENAFDGMQIDDVMALLESEAMRQVEDLTFTVEYSGHAVEGGDIETCVTGSLAFKRTPSSEALVKVTVTGTVTNCTLPEVVQAKVGSTVIDEDETGSGGTFELELDRGVTYSLYLKNSKCVPTPSKIRIGFIPAIPPLTLIGCG